MATNPGEEFKTMEDIIEEAEDAECQERYPNMPPIGTRVRRGPGWKWEDQDGHGPGTVTGHSKNRAYTWLLLLYINIIICITIFMYNNIFRVKVSWYELDNKWIVSVQLVGYRWCGTRGRGTSTGTGLTGCLTSSCVILHEYWSISWSPWGVWSPEVKATVSYFYDSSLDRF